MGEKRLTAPAPLFDLAEAKAHLRVYYNRDDAYITNLIATATSVVETFTRRAIASQQWAFTFNRWWNPLLVGRGQLISVDSITYIDEDNALQTLAASDYLVVDDDETQGSVYRSAAIDSWPRLSATHPQPITVTATVGYAQPPSDLVHAVKLQLGHLYENREEVIVSAVATEIPEGAKAMSYRYQVPLFR